MPQKRTALLPTLTIMPLNSLKSLETKARLTFTVKLPIVIQI